IALLPCSAARAETPGTVIDYPLPPGAQNAGTSIANGPGGMWMTFGGSNQIARVTTAGGVTTFDIPTANSGPQQISPGPDGNIWFTEQTASRIARITPGGVITEFPTPTANASPVAITAGPDGNVWFSEGTSPAPVGRITPAGVISEFPVPGNVAFDIITGPDGNLWITQPTTNNVVRMDPATQAATQFFAPGNPTSLAVADATSMWFTQQTGSSLGHITTAGTVTHQLLPTSSSGQSIVRGDDGNDWFVETARGVANVTPGGQVTEFGLGVPQMGEITSGPDSAIWVPEPSSNRLARVGTAASSAGIAPPAAGRTIGAETVSGTVRVRRPGSKVFVTLGPGQSLPTGTVVDTTSGTVRLSATSGAVAYAADFFDGQFQLAQSKAKGSTADLKLFGGSFKGCPKAPRASAKKKSIRHLWGDGSGKFRTVGRFSAASIRGTKWLTDDQCTGTLTRVTAGAVTVRDFVKRRNVVVRKGKSYFARARGS
ncbi:MAG: virginiamycin lyase, partial [Thermoleophilaceae bacterium]|nr:virginiamycin lyase [Thermoleophilaceae bacterium]